MQIPDGWMSTNGCNEENDVSDARHVNKRKPDAIIGQLSLPKGARTQGKQEQSTLVSTATHNKARKKGETDE